MSNARTNLTGKLIVVEPTKKENSLEHCSTSLQSRSQKDSHIAPQQAISAYLSTTVSGKSDARSESNIEITKLSDKVPEDGMSPTSVMINNTEPRLNSRMKNSSDTAKTGVLLEVKTSDVKPSASVWGRGLKSDETKLSAAESLKNKRSCDPSIGNLIDNTLSKGERNGMGLSVTKQLSFTRNLSKLSIVNTSTSNASGIGSPKSVMQRGSRANGKKETVGVGNTLGVSASRMMVHSAAEIPLALMKNADKNLSVVVINAGAAPSKSDARALQQKAKLSLGSLHKFELNVRAKPFKPKSEVLDFVPPTNRSFSNWCYGSEAEVEEQRRRKAGPQYLPPYHVLDVVGTRGTFLMPGHVPVQLLAAKGLVLPMPWMSIGRNE